MSNERITENIVRNLLKNKGYYNDDNIIIEEQSSQTPKIDKLLKKASKIGKGKGFPDFIISFINNPDDVIVVECKANTIQHESEDRKQYKDYAVDGVLLYANYLKEGFNVTAIAVSGQNERDKKISTFLWLKSGHAYKPIQDKIFLRPSEIANVITEQSKPITEKELKDKAEEYNKFLHKHSIPEVERCTLISAILIALQDIPFLQSYQSYTDNKDLIKNLIDACKRVLKENNLEQEKTSVIIDEYSKFKHNKSFNTKDYYDEEGKQERKNTLLRDFIIGISQDIFPYIKNSDFDILGQFYTEFIRYAGSDQKTGLVLTPIHITKFFCKVADLSENDIVFDECCGTAGFLVAAMNYMLKKAGHNTQKKKEVKSSQLLGIEKRADMFTHACSNMMMRGDGKSSILHGDCKKEENTNWIKKRNPTKAFLNPPYQDGNADKQLGFIENALKCLVKDGLCIAICQMSTAVSSKKSVIEVRKRLLQHHTLEAVFSMPTDLFYPISVNTSILVFKAHTPHPQGKKTFFGYFKDDGFVKHKKQGRIDKNKKWETIERKWINAYVNKDVISGLSVMQEVKAVDEWCAEAYMETDYSTLCEEDFIKTLHTFSTFMFSMGDLEKATKEPKHYKQVSLQDRKWRWFNLKDIFCIEKGKSLIGDFDEGTIPLISSTSLNNGVSKSVYKEKIELFGENLITVSSNGSVGESFYQSRPFYATCDVNVLTSKFTLNVYLAMFLNTIVMLEKYRFGYGRKWGKEKMLKSKIKLPIKHDGKPDWAFMEYYIKSLPYSSNLKEKSLNDNEQSLKINATFKKAIEILSGKE